MSELSHPEDSELNDLVSLTDETGRTLSCYVEKYLELDSKTYLLLLPVDAPIEIFAWNEDEEESAELIAIDENDAIAKVFADASAVLSEQNLTLKQTAYTLTASGDLPPLDPEEILQIELDEEDLEPEEFQILSRFYNEEQEYAICTPVDPLLFFGKKNEQGVVELLSDQESDEIGPLLEDILLDEA
jgi:Protein of unknown function (DUF3727)/Protein of unknown function (DUF1292)